MTRPQIIALATLCGAACLVAGTAQPTEPPAVESLLSRLEWIGSPHQYGSACIRIAGPPTIYIDPAGLSPEQCRPKADLILVTHRHDDHLSFETIAALVRPGTAVLLPHDAGPAPDAPALDGRASLSRMAVGERRQAHGVTIEAVPAYNTASAAHPREAGWLGYVLEIGGVRVYHSGDTSFIPEMVALSKIDIAVMTLRPTYMMSGSEMAEAARILHPGVLIPVHWLEPERPEIERLESDCPKATRLVILTPR